MMVGSGRVGATIKCPNCGTELPAGFKFCGGCGKALDAAPAPPPAPVATARALADERRTVTILFADISGFTAMSEKLDPEVVQEIMDRAFERLTAVITGYGGTIDKYIGDAVMALFGAPVALGDDPERAVRAGLGMQQVMKDYAEELKRMRGFGLAMRVGINTGKVIWGRVGGAGEKTFTVMGDAVNLASRLEHAAPLNGVLIGESTQRHVRTRFSLEALEPIQVKGKAEAQRVYRVLGEVAAPARATVMGPRSPFVGRDEEMAPLTAAIAAIKAGGPGVVATLNATAGSGKSRMVLELRHEAEEAELRTLSARAAPFGHGAPFAPWGDLLDRAAGLAGLAAGAARQKLREWLEETAPEAGVDARWFDELTNIADTADPEVQRRRENPAQFRQNLREAVVTWLWAAAKKRPTVFFAEDLHWWPAPSLELLANAAQVARKAAMVLLATRRPDPVAIEWPPEKDDRVISLGPLDESALQALAHGVLGAEVPKGLVARLLSTSGGSPFFAEELVQAYIDTGALRTTPDRAGWIWDEAKAERANLPTTVEGVTQARIDALPARERHVLQMAAVAGRTFWQGLIESMGEPAAAEALRQLSARDLVHGRRSRLAGEVEYAFKHATIQAVAYENSLKRERVTDHRRVAEWLETRAGNDPDIAPTIAEHFLRAEEKAKALPYLLRSAEEEVRTSAKAEQAHALDSAVEVAESLSQVGSHSRALQMRGRLRRIASHPGAEIDLKAALALSRDNDELASIAAAAGLELAGLNYERGDLVSAFDLANLSLTNARTASAKRVEASALRILGIVSKFRGNFQEAATKYEEALAVAEAIPDQALVGSLLTNVGNLYLETENFAKAREAFERGLTLPVIPETEAMLKSNLSVALTELGDYARAEILLDSAQQVAERIGKRSTIASVHVRRGVLGARRGSAWRDELTRGIELARSLGANEVLVEGLWRRAEAESALDVASATELLDEAAAIAYASGFKSALARIESIRSRVEK